MISNLDKVNPHLLTNLQDLNLNQYFRVLCRHKRSNCLQIILLIVEVTIYEDPDDLVELVDGVHVQTLHVVLQGVPDTGEGAGDDVEYVCQSCFIEWFLII